MSVTDTARNTIDAAIDALATRRRATSDATEKDAINDAIDDLEAQRASLNEEELADSARAVAAATDTLEGCVKAAQAGPFDSHLSALETAISGLQSVQANLFAPSRLWRTDNGGLAAPAAPPAAEQPSAPAAGAPPPRSPAALPNVGAGKNPQMLADEYQTCFQACVPDEAHAKTIQWYCDHMVKSRETYTHVGADLGIPWFFVGVIHGMEGGFNFGTHLHNGDPLSARTVHVPKGHPVNGKPPFTWSESAIDALTTEGFANQPGWSLPLALYRLETYNGFGYRERALRSPYLWSFSNLYSHGKYIADGEFDPNAVSEQCGAAVVLKRLVAMGILQQRPDGSLA